MIEEIKKNLITYKNFPIDGVDFIDISSILENKDYFNFINNYFYGMFKDKNIDKVVAIETRGFIFGSILAHLLNCGLVMIRKKGKFAENTIFETYTKEYGQDAIEMRKESIAQNENVILVDDVLATGGTLVAGINLLKRLNANIVAVCCPLEIVKLNGKSKIEFPFYSCLKI